MIDPVAYALVSHDLLAFLLMHCRNQVHLTKATAYGDGLFQIWFKSHGLDKQFHGHQVDIVLDGLSVRFRYDLDV